MTPHRTWSAATIACFGIVHVALYLIVPRQASAPTYGIKLHYALVHVPFGVLLLGALARLLPASGPNAWRSLTLAIGLPAATAGLWWQQQAGGARLRLDLVAATLLGLAVAALLPRLLPESVVRRWLGIERRGAGGEKCKLPTPRS